MAAPFYFKAERVPIRMGGNMKHDEEHQRNFFRKKTTKQKLVVFLKIGLEPLMPLNPTSSLFRTSLTGSATHAINNVAQKATTLVLAGCAAMLPLLAQARHLQQEHNVTTTEKPPISKDTVKTIQMAVGIPVAVLGCCCLALCCFAADKSRTAQNARGNQDGTELVPQGQTQASAPDPQATGTAAYLLGCCPI